MYGSAGATSEPSPNSLSRGSGDFIVAHPSGVPRRELTYLDAQINDRIIAINDYQSPRYIREKPARIRHRAKHPTHFACLKCMDGRVHLAQMTKTPMGIAKPFRCIGGRFRTFWHAFNERLDGLVSEATLRGTRSVVFVSYHFSRSSPQLGCAGWDYDVSAARAHAYRLSKELGEIYEDELVAIPMCAETDGDLLTLHGTNGDVSGEDFIDIADEDALLKIRQAMPNVDSQTLRDIMPFLMGNAQRVAELKQNPRDLSALDHRERVMALGEGFDWLAEANFALINNDVDPDMIKPIVTAGRILENNLRSAPAGDDATILTSVPYSLPGKDFRLAVARSTGWQEYAQKVFREGFPDLVKSGRLHYLNAVTFAPSKKLQVIDSGIVRL